MHAARARGNQGSLVPYMVFLTDVTVCKDDDDMPCHSVVQLSNDASRFSGTPRGTSLQPLADDSLLGGHPIVTGLKFLDQWRNIGLMNVPNGSMNASCSKFHCFFFRLSSCGALILFAASTLQATLEPKKENFCYESYHLIAKNISFMSHLRC